MKHKIAIDFTFDMKEIRKAIVLVTGETLDDQEIMDRYINREPTEVDTADLLGNRESLQMCMAFLATMIADIDPDLTVKK